MCTHTQVPAVCAPILLDLVRWTLLLWVSQIAVNGTCSKRNRSKLSSSRLGRGFNPLSLILIALQGDVRSSINTRLLPRATCCDLRGLHVPTHTKVFSITSQSDRTKSVAGNNRQLDWPNLFALSMDYSFG